MKWINKLKINHKIFGAILVSLLFLATVLGWIIWDSLTNVMKDELMKRGTTIAENIAETTSDYILFDDHYSVHLFIKETKEVSEEVRYILIFDSNGNLYEHTFPDADYLPKGIIDAYQSVPNNQQKHTTLSSNEGNIYDVLVPIEEGEAGYVRIGMSDKNAMDYIYSRISKLLLATLLVSIGALGIAYFITRIFTKPINRLVHVATGISRGNLSLRAKETNNNEVGKLAHALNEMADNLINSNQEIDKLLKELQEKDRIRDKLIAKLLSAQEDERKRISRELHDETSQALTSLMVTMRILANEAKDSEQRELLDTSRDITSGILHQIRDLAVELRPPILDNMGLVSAIKKYARNFQEKYGIKVLLYVPDDDIQNIDDHVSVTLYRIVQESLTNVARHTSATEIELRMNINAYEIKMTIHDNGQGIHKKDFEKARQQDRIGIHGMKERAELHGGSFFINTNSVGGTEIAISIPLIGKEDD